MNSGCISPIFENRRFQIFYFVILAMFVYSQFSPSRFEVRPTVVTNKVYIPSQLLASSSATTGWELTTLQWDQLKLGINYLFGLSQFAIEPQHQKYLLRVNSFTSSVFAIFLGLSAILLPLVLFLLLCRPVWAWWLTPTMFLSSIWWFSEHSRVGFYFWILSALMLSMLVVSVLIKRGYFRSGLNAVAGPKSLPFHIPVLYIAALIIIAALGG